jgi:hypothetical protein
VCRLLFSRQLSKGRVFSGVVFGDFEIQENRVEFLVWRTWFREGSHDLCGLCGDGKYSGVFAKS